MVTPIYGFEELSYQTEGWNVLVDNNMDLIEDYLATYLRYQVDSGEDISAGMPVQCRQQKWIEAKADGTRQPANAIAIEAGTSGEWVRARRIGEMEDDDWAFDPSGEVWLAPTGGVTQTEPGSNVQILGTAVAESAIIVQL
jgi:hypothetical protein